jgi:polysaccharide export outer membrane protein
MRIRFTTRAAAVVLAGFSFFCCELAGQDQPSSYNSAVESSSHPSSKALKAQPSEAQPAEIASTNPTPVPPAPTPEPAAVDTKVRQDITPPATVKEPVKNDKADESYIVGIADELQISVWKEPDLSGGVVVRPDGMITVPVVNDVYVVGLTTKQVQDILTDKLKPVVAEPQVTVIVKNIRSRKVYLVGQVGHPGSVALTGHETVLQILAASGGLNLYAKSDKIYILRQGEGKQQQKLSFNYKKALKGNDPNADFPLANGDVIVVP